MRIDILGKNLKVREEYKERIIQKLDKYSKYFHSDITAYVVFSHVKGFQVVEVTIPLKHGAIIRAEESSYDMLSSIDTVVERMHKQITKYKTNLKKRFRSNESIKFEDIPEEAEQADISIVKTKNFPIKPMDPLEAVLQMNLINHSFFVFLNAETEKVNVVYKRKDGSFGLIEPTF